MSASLLNKAQLKKYALDAAAANRHHKFSRVSEDFMIKAEAHLRQWVVAHVKNLPSSGETIR